MTDETPKAHNPDLLARLAPGEEARDTAPDARDLRGRVTTGKDASAHRRYAWLYEDLLN